MTTAEAFAKCLGMMNGISIEKARERFAIEDMKTMDRVCNYQSAHSKEITDFREIGWFFNHRVSASGLVIRAMSAGN